ncbi:MAG: hypothetical protein AB7V13_17570 [Pseudorhodoplanes sp.]|uniref:hypothetical protein n=1 Tax=Pseudorhodoplanes sp. TaxID=1934341 RepID=UPI003D0F2ECD
MALRFFAVLLTGLALIAPGAHLYEMANKMHLARQEYFVVQSIYTGWWIAGLLLPLAFCANVALAWTLSGDRSARYLALGAAFCIAANLTIFYFVTQPANAATNNWTVIPDNWMALRKAWEVSHAVNAGVMLVAFALTIAAAIRR